MRKNIERALKEIRAELQQLKHDNDSQIHICNCFGFKSNKFVEVRYQKKYFYNEAIMNITELLE